MSSERMPILGGVIPAFELSMMQWEQLDVNTCHYAPFIKLGLKWAQKYYQHMGQTHTYTIAMCKSQCSINTVTANPMTIIKLTI